MTAYLYAEVPPGTPGHDLRGIPISLRGTVEQQLIYLNFTSERRDLLTGHRVYRIPKKMISKTYTFPGFPSDSLGPYMNVGGMKLRFLPDDPTRNRLVIRDWNGIP